MIRGNPTRFLARMHLRHSPDRQALANLIRQWGRALGFDAIGIAAADPLREAEVGLQGWLANGYQGEMNYMARHGTKRARPEELLRVAQSVITARLNYWPAASNMAAARDNLADPERAYVSRYAVGRDYHKLLRARLKALAERIQSEIGDSVEGYAQRVFTDSAPLMEVALAEKSGLGWRGKHTLLLSRESGSTFFLGEIICTLDLPVDPPLAEHCGTCAACLSACPTGAIVAPYRLDARRCISYLTIELAGSIPVEWRPLIGNRVYGCDDCQLCCPWNRHAPHTREPDFAVRHGLDQAKLSELFAWNADEFKQKMAGSAIHRIGHERWLRNLAVGLGNAPTSAEVLSALSIRRDDRSPLVREHVAWALARHQA